jgi:cell division protein FtsW (lipid II flippase)
VIRPIEIPVVESDFAGSYLIGRLGAAAGLMLYGAQALLLIVVTVGFVRLSWAPSNGQIDEIVRRYVAIVVAGAAWLMLLQWSLSWSNMLGLLPVMGQPMTWLSYATSHHLFMAVPCILVLVAGLRYAGMPRYNYTPRDPPRSRYNSWLSW